MGAWWGGCGVLDIGETQRLCAPVGPCSSARSSARSCAERRAMLTPRLPPLLLAVVYAPGVCFGAAAAPEVDCTDPTTASGRCCVVTSAGDGDPGTNSTSGQSPNPNPNRRTLRHCLGEWLPNLDRSVARPVITFDIPEPGLFIAVAHEGTVGFDLYIQLYNPTSSPIRLADYGLVHVTFSPVAPPCRRGPNACGYRLCLRKILVIGAVPETLDAALEMDAWGLGPGAGCGWA